jgi:hypothetical protein
VPADPIALTGTVLGEDEREKAEVVEAGEVTGKISSRDGYYGDVLRENAGE